MNYDVGLRKKMEMLCGVGNSSCIGVTINRSTPYDKKLN